MTARSRVATALVEQRRTPENSSMRVRNSLTRVRSQLRVAFSREEKKESASSRSRMLRVSSLLCRTTKQYYSVSKSNYHTINTKEDKITHYINYLFWTYLSTVVKLDKYRFVILYRKISELQKELAERKP